MRYCGLDLGTKSIAICVVDEKSEILFEAESSLNKAEIKKKLNKFKALKCVVEAAPLAEHISRTMEELGHSIDIIEARRAASIFKTKRKTDPLDARKLALIAKNGWYTKVHRKSERARALRTYLTGRMQLVKMAGALNSSIRGLLKANGIVIGKGNFEQQVRKALIGCDTLVKQVIVPMLEVLQHLQQQEKALYQALDRKVVKKDAVIKRLTSIDGVGPATAAAFVATIDDPKRFAEGEQVASYLGLVPSVYQSGETEIRGRITKDGDELLRWLLVESATALLARCQRKSSLREWGLKIQEKKGFGKARVAVARKLAMLMHTLWMRGDTFDPQLTKIAA